MSRRRPSRRQYGKDAEGASSDCLGEDNFSDLLDAEIGSLTLLRTRPHRRFSQDIPGKRSLPVSTLKMLIGRESYLSGKGRFSAADGCHILSQYFPVNGPWMVDHIRSRAYVSQFSRDGTIFIAGFQGSHIRVYDVDRNWKIKKNILAKALRWTITDTCLSPDQRFLVYSSMYPVVNITNIESSEKESIANITEIHDGFDLSCPDDDYDNFGIFSVKFSPNGRELVASGSEGFIYIHDLISNRRTLRIPAHSSDVNTICFADESDHVLYSGSDDHLCKVWDRRCTVTDGKAAGILEGHVQGITFVDSRGDGRYFISNGKDQTTKLWDTRKMSSNSSNIPDKMDIDWDYRWMEYPTYAIKIRHPRDTSLATYRGHSVLQTLIRCYFSPSYSTGQKYIYSGSSDASVYFYDLLTGTQVRKLNYHQSPVRDCSWHPFYPIMVSSSWDGFIVRWEFPGNENERVLSRQTPYVRRIVL